MEKWKNGKFQKIVFGRNSPNKLFHFSIFPFFLKPRIWLAILSEIIEPFQGWLAVAAVCVTCGQLAVRRLRASDMRVSSVYARPNRLHEPVLCLNNTFCCFLLRAGPLGPSQPHRPFSVGVVRMHCISAGCHCYQCVWRMRHCLWWFSLPEKGEGRCAMHHPARHGFTFPPSFP